MAAPGYSSRPAGNDIYTVLLGAAVAVVAGTLGFVIYQSVALLGVPFPSFS
ncbi:MAG TPA: hypothetical protein VNT79_02575 [Phycisphaerae bacterium]|nr:hypothetical protein [Phycisphaerae bacterium]